MVTGNIIDGCLGAKVWRHWLQIKRKFLEGIERFSMSTMMVVSQVYTPVKTHQIVHYKWVQIIVHKLYLNTID